MKKIQTLRGMRDLVGLNAKKYERFSKIALDEARKANFDFIQTPILEETRLFERTVGDSSDIVNKEMYSFLDKSEHQICLRPEATASVVRSFVERKLDRIGGVNRYFYLGAMFRYERPQKGRFRQFFQFGCECFGEGSVYEDANMIYLIASIFNKLGIKYKVQLNSLGCKDCSTKYKQNLNTKLISLRESFCPDCNKRMDTNQLRIFDCKNKSCNDISKDLPKITDSLCTSCNYDFAKLQSLLQDLDISFDVNKNLVRGLDYYNKTAFEFISDEVGAQNAIAGGGRYDYLAQMLDGLPTFGVGFAIGVDRILDLMNLEEDREGFYIGALDGELEESYILKVIDLGFKKRKKEKTYTQYKAMKLKNHLKQADKINARYCAVIGENELKEEKIWIKDLELKTNTLIAFDEFIL